MSKLRSLSDAVSQFVPDGSSVAIGLQLEQMIPFAAAHEIIRQKKRGLTLIGPISDICFDQLIGAGCVDRVIAAWVGNAMMGSAYNFRRGFEQEGVKVVNMTNFSMALALQAGAMGVPFLPTRTALGSDVARNNEFFAEVQSPFTSDDHEAGDGTASKSEKLHAVKALRPDVAIVHAPRADREGNTHSWGSFGIMIEATRAAKHVIVVAEEIVDSEVIASDPNRTIIPGFLVSAVVECPHGAHPSPVQGCYKRDDAFFRQYHEQTKTKADSDAWLQRWVYGVRDRDEYINQLGGCRIEDLGVKQHAYAAQTDYGY
jgi:glutaconate CoA-transferase subunit A